MKKNIKIQLFYIYYKKKENMKNILAENMRRFKTKNLSEQITKALPPIAFNESFLDNMVMVYKTPQLTAALNTLNENIIAAKQEEDMRLQSISISINAGSTPLSATNSLPAGVTRPDHDYGGTLSLNVCQPGQSDQCWLPTARRDERVLVPDGNSFLANQRALNLKVYLEQYLKGKYPGADINIKINNIDQSSTKFASAVIDGIVFKNPRPDITNFYIEDYTINIKNKLYIPVSPSRVWGKNKLNTNNDFTKEKAEALLKKNVTDREVVVIKLNKAQDSQYEEWYGLNKPYVEVLNYKTQTQDKQTKDITKFWFADYNSWLTEKNNIQKYKQATVAESVNQSKTLGAASFIGRLPALPQKQ